MVEAILYRNELVVVINDIIATKILLQYMIFIAMTYFVAKTYYHRVYCNGWQRLTFVAIKVYCNKIKVIATKNFVAINLFTCSDCIHLLKNLNLLTIVIAIRLEIWTKEIVLVVLYFI